MALSSSPEPIAGAGPVQQQDSKDVSPFEAAPPLVDVSSAPVAPIMGSKQRAPLAEGQAQRQRGFSLFNCCFGRSKPRNKHKAHHHDGSIKPGPDGAAPAGPGRLSASLSHRDSMSLGKRPSLHHTSSIAYSEVDWFDAHSSFHSHVEDHADLLAQLDQALPVTTTLPAQPCSLGLQHGCPWVPDPPLMFAGAAPLRFLPYPLTTTQFCGYFARDEARSTPSPQPVDVMLGVNFITRKVHDSIPGALVTETDREFHMMVKPSFAPPGLARYAEVYDKATGAETSWLLRRDLRPGRSTGRCFMTADGTLINRIEWRGLMSSTVDTVMEEFWQLEDNGNTLLCRQCCYHVPTGKTAVQLLVGIRQPHPPKGWQ